MENKKNIKKTFWISTIALMLLLVGMSLNILVERNPLRGDLTSQYSSNQTFASFQKDVVPILNRHCSVCHGVDEEKYQNIKSSSQSSVLLRWPIGVSGRIETKHQVRQLYNDLLRNTNNPDKNNLVGYDIHPIESHLLRAGLSKKYSGSFHHEIFNSPHNEDYLALEQWIVNIHSNKTKPKVQRSESEAFFTEKVVPILIRKNCFGCHGPMAFNDLRLDPGISILKDRFTQGIHKRNRRAMLGINTRMVHLSGDVETIQTITEEYSLLNKAE